MLNRATKSEIRDLYDGSYASIRELSTLFNVSTYKIRYFVNHKGYRESQKRFGNKWRSEHPERAKEIDKKALKKYNARPEIKIKIHRYYFKRKKEGCFKTEKYKERIRRYYFKRKERGDFKTKKYKKMVHRCYLNKKKRGYFKTKEFKEKMHEYYLKRKNNL